MSNKTIIKDRPDHEIWCYGTIKPDSSFFVECDNEIYSGIVADIDTETYDTWEKVVDYLLNASHFSGHDIEEVSTD